MFCDECLCLPLKPPKARWRRWPVHLELELEHGNARLTETNNREKEKIKASTRKISRAEKAGVAFLD